MLKDIRDEFNTAILLITQYGVVADMADRVIVMNQGRIVESADVYELFQAPKDVYTQKLLAAVPKIAEETRRANTRKVPLLVAPDADAEPADIVVKAENMSVTYPAHGGSPAFQAVKRRFFLKFAKSHGSSWGIRFRSPPSAGRLWASRRFRQVEVYGMSSLRFLRKSADCCASALAIFQDPYGSFNPC